MLDYNVLIHYHNAKGDYHAFNLWYWQDNELGKDGQFSSYDYFGARASLVYSSQVPIRQGKVIVKKSDWSQQSVDYEIDLLPIHLTTEIWLIEGDEQVYYSRQAAMASHYYHYRIPHAYAMATQAEEFDAYWGYSGQLGSSWGSQGSSFALWAPTAQKVDLVLYKDDQNDGEIDRVVSLNRGHIHQSNHAENTVGLWSLYLPGDWRNRAYQYKVTFAHHEELTRDPYSEVVTENGLRTVLVATEERQAEGFVVKQKEASWRLENPCQAVIYEMHVRDLTKSETSGVPKALRGTYLGAAYSGSKNKAGLSTGFDYIKDLGVNYVQLQPISDRHKDYDANGEVTYNWGYDPQNYNAPETSLSSDPSKPALAMQELKSMIQSYHEAGIGVIFDVVYNHIYSTFNSPFQATVPDYYYRMNRNGSFQNGTGVGSETASEHEMFRKYMIDSLVYWVKEYGVDGFRFDLMGIHDVETMRQIRQALDEIDPRILTYGEGWDMGTGLAPEDKAKKDNAYQMPGIGFFNDTERDAVKGAEVYGGLKTGFVSGSPTEGIIAKSILGSGELGTYLSPSQVLNYVEAHDNYNLRDLLTELHPFDQPEMIVNRVEAATAMNLLMQGMSFMELGQEFLRTKLVGTGLLNQVTAADKERAMNSYNAPDAVNAVNWDVLTENQKSMEFIRQVIALKTSLPVFSYQTYQEIYEHVYVHTAQEGSGLVVFELHEDETHYLVVFNMSEYPYYLPQDASYRHLVSNNSTQSTEFVKGSSVAVYQIDYDI